MRAYPCARGPLARSVIARPDRFVGAQLANIAHINSANRVEIHMCVAQTYPALKTLELFD